MNIKSLKLLKNKSMYYFAIDYEYQLRGPLAVYYDTPPKNNWDAWQDSFKYDGEDNNYRYYHLPNGNVPGVSDNSFIIIQ